MDLKTTFNLHDGSVCTFMYSLVIGEPPPPCFYYLAKLKSWPSGILIGSKLIIFS